MRTFTCRSTFLYVCSYSGMANHAAQCKTRANVVQYSCIMQRQHVAYIIAHESNPRLCRFALVIDIDWPEPCLFLEYTLNVLLRTCLCIKIVVSEYAKSIFATENAFISGYKVLGKYTKNTLPYMEKTHRHKTEPINFWSKQKNSDPKSPFYIISNGQ